MNKIKIYRLPWRVFGFTKLKGKLIFDLGRISIWIFYTKDKK